jgi:hypothetical protein
MTRFVTQGFLEEEYERLLKAKGRRTWHDFVLEIDLKSPPTKPRRLKHGMGRTFMVFSDEEFEAISKKKGDKTWHDYLLAFADKELAKRKS